MSKCQMNKYAAGGKCGSMSSSSASPSGTLNIAALMAQREKDDMFFSAKAPSPSPSPLQQEQQLIVKKKDNQSDIDIILGGD